MTNPTLYAPPTREPPPDEHEQRYLGPGVVVRADRDRRSRVDVALPWSEDHVQAEVATAGADGLRQGQRVLVCLTAGGAAYVIGTLGAVDQRVSTREGAAAELVDHGEGERLEVRDPDGGLVFEYDPAGKRAHVRIPEGDLDVVAPKGDLTLGAGGAVRLTGQTIDLAATSAVRAFVHAAASGITSAIRLGRRSTRIDTDGFRMNAKHADVSAQTGHLTGDRMETDVDELRTTARRIRTTAEKVTQRFGSLCQRVKGLLQTRAGRLRSLVSGSWHARAKRADLRTEETFKVDGRKIHLG